MVLPYSSGNSGFFGSHSSSSEEFVDFFFCFGFRFCIFARGAAMFSSSERSEISVL